MTQQEQWNIGNRGAVSKEEGDLVRDVKAMLDDLFLSSWLRTDIEGTVKEGPKKKR